MNSTDDPYFSTLVGPRTHCFQFVKISLLTVSQIPMYYVIILCEQIAWLPALSLEVVWHQKIRKINQETNQMSLYGLHVLLGEKCEGLRKIVSAIFSLSDNFHAILSEKMRKQRGIAPENDPWHFTPLNV